MKLHERNQTRHEEVVAMSDSKSLYSEASRFFVEVDTRQNAIDARRYANSKAREREYGAIWENSRINLNDIVDHFAPMP